jgi:hypothetical protein
MRVPGRNTGQMINASTRVLGILGSVVGPVVLMKVSVDLPMPWQGIWTLALGIGILPVIHVALAWQVDIRADNGYIVAPTTRTAAGTYRRVGQSTLPADLPAWLAAELARTGHVPAAQPASPLPAKPPRQRRAAKAAARLLEPLLGDVAACAAVQEGASFTEKLNRAAYTAGGLIQGGHLTESEARTLLLETACRARPHQERRNLTIIESALSAGAQSPLHPRGRS